MTNLYKFNPGINTSFTSELNSMFAEASRNAILTTVEQLIDRSISFSTDGGLYAEAYTDSNGRNNTVDTTSTTATFNTDKYETTSSGVSYIYHDIPSGYFSDTSKTLLCSALIDDLEDGASVTFRVSAVDNSKFWDLSGGSYSGNSYTPFTSGVTLNSCKVVDLGTKLYTTCNAETAERIYYSDLTTPYDVSTAVTDPEKWLDISSEVSIAIDFWISDDGTRLFVLDATGSDTVYSYTLSTPWDASTGTYDSKSSGLSASSGNSSIFIGDSGTKLYAVDNSANYVYQYSMSTAYDLSTLTYASKSFAITDQYGIALKSDGSKMYLSNPTADTIIQYSLSTDWDVSTATADLVTLDVSGEASTASNMGFSEEGGFLYVADASSDSIYQYDLSSNSTDITDFEELNTLIEHDAWSEEPHTLIIKLTPKSSSPTAGYPSIKGVGLIGDY